jgi:hypothetical protein
MAGPPENWHLDKKVPIGIIAALLIQTLTFAVLGSRWMATTDARLTYLEQVQSGSSGQDGRIIRLETRFEGMQQTLLNIERMVGELIRERRASLERLPGDP